MEEALPSLGEAKEDSRLLPGLRPQAGQGTGVETARCCGLTMGGSERAVEGLIARPLTLQGLGICCPTRSGFGGRGWPPGGSPEGARFPKVQVGQGGSQATAAALAQPPTLGTGKYTVTPARSQLLSRDSCSASRHFLLLVLAPLLSLAGSQTQGRPWVLMT